MNITDFFEQRAGLWLSQRTDHDLSSKQTNSVRSEIVAELLPIEGIAVQKLGILAEITCCLRVTSDNQSSILAAAADRENLQVGKLWRSLPTAEQLLIGRFTISQDNVLTMTMASAEEKLWFALPNLCMRTGVAIGPNSQASFWTEVRKVSK